MAVVLDITDPDNPQEMVHIAWEALQNDPNAPLDVSYHIVHRWIDVGGPDVMQALSVVDADSVAWSLSMVAVPDQNPSGPDGIVHLVWNDIINDGSVPYSAAMYRSWRRGDWQSSQQSLFEVDLEDGVKVALTVDSSNLLHLAIGSVHTENGQSEHDLDYLYANGTAISPTWSTPEKIQDNVKLSTSNLDIAVANGEIFISWGAGTRSSMVNTVIGTRYMYRSNGNWSTPEPIDTSGYTSTASASIAGCHLAADPQEGFHLTYSAQFTSDQDGLFYRRVIPGSGDKRYYAGGQLLATRVDGTLYYALNDQTGTSFTVTDDTGGFVGRIVYDGYGAVLVNTLPTVLGQTLPDAPDAATGLIHQGDGRYYDPRLGRPLQPNLDDAPQIVPQALNRYTATPLGQPGISQVAQRNAVGVWAQQQGIKLLIGEGAERFLFRYGDAFTYAVRETGWLRIEIIAQKRFIPPSLENLGLISRKEAGFCERAAWGRIEGNGIGAIWKRKLLVIPVRNDAYDIEHRIGRVHSSVYDSLNEATRAYTEVIERETETIFARNTGAILSDIGGGIFLDVAFQIAGDWNNPYLTIDQRWGRVGTSAFGAVVSTGGGLWLEGLLIAGGFASGPAGWAGLGFSLSLDFVWNFVVTPFVYEAIGLNPERNLLIIGGN